jgi:hypothetical protein
LGQLVVLFIVDHRLRPYRVVFREVFIRRKNGFIKINFLESLSQDFITGFLKGLGLADFRVLLNVIVNSLQTPVLFHDIDYLFLGNIVFIVCLLFIIDSQNKFDVPDDGGEVVSDLGSVCYQNCGVVGVVVVVVLRVQKFLFDLLQHQPEEVGDLLAVVGV